ncbi:hypothetical protein [Bartonella sp. HY761]|uniref:hypothetical protein n=1 Tax=Bartonella sp. HY761 TaxID=2979330 RepID=UPI002203F1BA|nr:hypothetical protein [Bartonella sp. HY761]UXN06509.1 hypothetical protein N6A79_00320 [Bartonella sp. HY761]
MSELQDNSLDIELPVKEIRLKYPGTWFFTGIAIFWTVFFGGTFLAIVVFSGYLPLKHIWTDWVISQNYEVVPELQADYGCRQSNYHLIKCGFSFEKDGILVEKYKGKFDYYPFTLYDFLTPDNFALQGKSAVVRSVNDPNKITIQVGIDTLKTRLAAVMAIFIFMGSMALLGLWGASVWCRFCYHRLTRNKVHICAVKIDRVDKRWGGTFYYLYGLKRDGYSDVLTIVPNSLALALTYKARNAGPFTLIKRRQEPIFLNEEHTIGVAIQPQGNGGGLLLDYNLTQLALSKENKNKLLNNIKAYQQWIAQHPKKLRQISDFIDQEPETKIQKVFNPPKD